MAKLSVGDWVWVKISEPTDGLPFVGDYRAEILRIEFDPSEKDNKLYISLVDFPDQPEWTTYQQLVLPYYAKPYDGRFLAARDKAQRKADPQSWYTDFNLFTAFVTRNKLESLRFGDKVCEDPKTFFLEYEPSKLLVKLLQIDNSKATITWISYYDFKHSFFRNLN